MSIAEDAVCRGAEHAVRLLLADDDDEMRHLLAQALRDAGYRVTEVVDPSRIPAAFGDEVAGPLADVDLIIADVRMPTMSGLELVAQLRQRDCCFQTP